MITNRKINLFAEKWLNKFKDDNTDVYDILENMGEDCIKLQFKMDCGTSFNDKYNEAFVYLEELKKIISQVTEIDLLASAIFSKWRYFNHWAFDGKVIFQPKYRSWFILALQRLFELTK